jgi:hypothetical protein
LTVTIIVSGPVIPIVLATTVAPVLARFLTVTGHLTLARFLTVTRHLTLTRFLTVARHLTLARALAIARFLAVARHLTVTRFLAVARHLPALTGRDIQHLAGVDVVRVVEAVGFRNLVRIHVVLAADAVERFAVADLVVSSPMATIFTAGVVLNAIVTVAIIVTAVTWFLAIARFLIVTIAIRDIQHLASVDVVRIIQVIGLRDSVGAYTIVPADTVQGFSVPDLMVVPARCKRN